MTNANATGWVLTILLALTLVGCPPPAEDGPTPAETETLADAQGRFDALCAQAKQVTLDQTAEVYAEFRKAGLDITDAEVALELFRVYTARTSSWRAIVVDEINPFDMARVVLGERLAEFKHAESPQLLVNMLTDMQFELRGAMKDALGRSLTTLGPAALPFLRTVPVTHHRRAFADELIAHIQTGTIYGDGE